MRIYLTKDQLDLPFIGVCKSGKYWYDGDTRYVDDIGTYCIGVLRKAELNTTEKVIKNVKPEKEKRLYLKDMVKALTGKEAPTVTQIAQAKWFIEQTHPYDRAQHKPPYVHAAIKTKKGDYCQSGFKLDELNGSIADILSLEANTYMTVANYLPGRNRKKENVSHAQSIIIDLDIYKTVYRDWSIEQILADMESKELLDVHPSFITSSGRGIYFVYVLESPVFFYSYKDRKQNTRAVKSYEQLVKKLVDKFAEYGADSNTVDVSHIFKLPGSYGVANKATSFVYRWTDIAINGYMKHDFNSLVGTLELDSETWAIREQELYDTFIDVTYPWQEAEEGYAPETHFKATVSNDKAEGISHTTKAKKPLKTQATACETENIQSFSDKAMGRIADLEKLLQLREGEITLHGDKVTSGRNRFLFVVAMQYKALGYDDNSIRQQLRQLNAKFLEPVSETELLNEISLDSLYSYSDAKIIENFAITEDEIAQFKSIGHKKQWSKDKQNAYRKAQRRDIKGNLPRQTEKENKCKKILKLCAEGLTNNEIAKALGVSLSTVMRAKREA